MPGPEEILKQLAGDKPKPEPKPEASKPTGEEAPDPRPPENLKPPLGLIQCPCCGTLEYKFYQEAVTRLPSILCRCGTKVVLDVDQHNHVMTENWNRRHIQKRASEETLKWLSIVDYNLRDENMNVHSEASYDPYTFALIMKFFQELILRKTLLDHSQLVCPFCGSPDFIDMKDSLRCGNLSCSALIPVAFFECAIHGPHPHTYFKELFEKQGPTTPESKPADLGTPAEEPRPLTKRVLRKYLQTKAKPGKNPARKSTKKTIHQKFHTKKRA